MFDDTTPNTVPNLETPLIYEPTQSIPPAPTTGLGPLEYLVGTWTNQNIHGTNKGGETAPYSYNLMPLPQEESYILKNFSYYEEITFSAIHGDAPNRGGDGTQVANTLFYEQRIYFSEGPAKDSLVHAENGSWLYLTDRKQLFGPYGDGDGPNVGDKTVLDSVPPTQTYDIIKQMSVPHGNSILASGSSATEAGSPTIPPLSSSAVFPPQVDTSQYTTTSVGNPDPAFTANPNQPLIDAIGVKNASSYIQLDVDTENGGYPIINIAFEQKHADVTHYTARYWLEAFDNSSNFTQLQYTQTIYLDIPISGFGTISFPHITTNTLTNKVRSWLVSLSRSNLIRYFPGGLPRVAVYSQSPTCHALRPRDGLCNSPFYRCTCCWLPKLQIRRPFPF